MSCRCAHFHFTNAHSSRMHTSSLKYAARIPNPDWHVQFVSINVFKSNQYPHTWVYSTQIHFPRKRSCSSNALGRHDARTHDQSRKKGKFCVKLAWERVQVSRLMLLYKHEMWSICCPISFMLLRFQWATHFAGGSSLPGIWWLSTPLICGQCECISNGHRISRLHGIAFDCDRYRRIHTNPVWCSIAEERVTCHTTKCHSNKNRARYSRMFAINLNVFLFSLIASPQQWTGCTFVNANENRMRKSIDSVGIGECQLNPFGIHCIRGVEMSDFSLTTYNAHICPIQWLCNHQTQSISVEFLIHD